MRVVVTGGAGFIGASSSSVYGATPTLPKTEDLPLTRGDPPRSWKR